MLVAGTTSVISNTAQQRPQQVTGTQNNGVTIQVKPSDTNVKSGDRSNNSLEVSVTTEKTQVSTEVSREQALSGLERQLQKRVIDQATGGNSPNTSRLAARAIQNTEINPAKVNDLASVRNQKKLAETYLNVATDTNPSSNSVSSTDGAALYNQAINSRIKQTLFFSGAEKASSSFHTKA